MHVYKLTKSKVLSDFQLFSDLVSGICVCAWRGSPTCLQGEDSPDHVSCRPPQFTPFRVNLFCHVLVRQNLRVTRFSLWCLGSPLGEKGWGAPTNQRRKPRRCCAGGGSSSGSSSSSISPPLHGGDNLGYRRMDPDSKGRFTHRTRRWARCVARRGEDGAGTATHDGSEVLRGDRRWDYISGLNRICVYECSRARPCVVSKRAN